MTVAPAVPVPAPNAPVCASGASGAPVPAPGAPGAPVPAPNAPVCASGAPSARRAPAQKRRLARKGPPRLVIEARLATQIEALLDQDPRVRLDLDDSAHQMRIAIRRLRALLKTFRPLFAREPATVLDTELQWLAGVLAPIRDSEVLALRLTGAISSLQPDQVGRGAQTAAQKLVLALQSEHARARAHAGAVLDGARYATLKGSLVGLRDNPLVAPGGGTFGGRPLLAAGSEQRRGRVGRTGAAEALAALVRRERVRLDRRVAVALGSVAGQHRDDAFHSARKSTKRLRYAFETLEPAFGPRALEGAKVYARLQASLGERQDAVMSIAYLRRAIEREAVRSPEDAYAYGVLTGLELQRIGKADRAFEKAWRKSRVGRARQYLKTRS